MSFTERDKQAARIIVSLHETSKKRGDATAVAVLPDGAGISYGSHQATHRSGTLSTIVDQYCWRGGRLADVLRPYSKILHDTSSASIVRAANDRTLKVALRQAGTDPLMIRVQEDVFDTRYLQPAIKACEGSNFHHPLSLAVIYDSMIHGSFSLIRDRVALSHDEKWWITKYVATRRSWLAHHAKPILRKTVYRMDTFQRLIAADNWGLVPPFTAHGTTIVATDLS